MIYSWALLNSELTKTQKPKNESFDILERWCMDNSSCKEIWLRKIFLPYVQNRTLNTIFRPDRRLSSEEHPKAFIENKIIRVRIIEKSGAHWAGLKCILLPKPNVRAVITKVTAKMIKELEPSDFIGSSPCTQNIETLKYQLCYIYDKNMAELNDDFWITRTTFQYLD